MFLSRLVLMGHFTPKRRDFTVMSGIVSRPGTFIIMSFLISSGVSNLYQLYNSNSRWSDLENVVKIASVAKRLSRIDKTAKIVWNGHTISFFFRIRWIEHISLLFLGWYFLWQWLKLVVIIQSGSLGVMLPSKWEIKPLV